MPGRVGFFDGSVIAGWAAHPVHEKYPMTVHAIVQGRVTASVVGDRLGPQSGFGFTIELSKQVEASHLQIMLGETDEYLELPSDGSKPPRRTLTVEDLIGVQTVRRWVTGECYVDAQKSGWPIEAIVEMLAFDILGRHLDDELVRSISDVLGKGGSLDGVRKSLLGSEEYSKRSIYAERAPGAVFSFRMVKGVPPAVLASFVPRIAVFNLPASSLSEPDDQIFIADIWRRLHSSEPKQEFITSMLREMKLGRSRVDVVRNIAALK